MKKKLVLISLSLVIIVSIIVVLSLNAKAEDTENSMAYYESKYGNTYLGRGYNLLENSVSFKDVSTIICDNNVSIFNYEGDNNLYNIPVKKMDNETHFSLSKIVSNSQLDCVSKYIKLYEKGINTTSQETYDWNIGNADIGFIKETMNQLDIVGTERIDYSLFKADTSMYSLEISSEDYGKHVRKEFLDDLFSQDARYILDKYGTHVLTSVNMGGQVETIYTLVSNDSAEMVEIENYLSAYMDRLYSDTANYTSIDSRLSYENKEKLNTFIKTDSRKVNINNTIVAKLQNNIGVKFNGDFVSWENENKERPLFIGPAANGLEEISEIIRRLEPTEQYTKDMLRQKAVEIADEYKKYYEEVKANQQNELNDKYGKFINSCVEIHSEPIAIENNRNFDASYALDERVQNLHKGYTLGTMKLYNAVKSANGENFSSTESNYMKLMYQVGTYDKKLPVGMSDATKHELVYIYTSLPKMDRLGLGGYYTELEYYDGIKEIVTTGSDLYNISNLGKAITIVNLNDNKFLRAKVEAHGGLKKIKVNVMYKTKAKYQGKFFKETQDWLCAYEINFDK